MRSLPVRPVTASDSECGAPSARAEIDATDLAIIQILQDDGRASFTSIAKQLNISEGAVRNRVSQLTDSRLLKVIGVANPIALGYNAFALIGLNIAPGSDPQVIAESFGDRDEVTYVVFVAGRFDLLVEFRVDSLADSGFRGFACTARRGAGAACPNHGSTPCLDRPRDPPLSLHCLRFRPLPG
jgi:Lrp/AsnC family transcriptional regulator for asnA, asnC and gidA